MNKKLIMLGMVIGSTVGAYLPELWGAGVFSFSSILGAFIGGVLGIWIMVKISGD